MELWGQGKQVILTCLPCPQVLISEAEAAGLELESRAFSAAIVISSGPTALRITIR